MRFSSSAKAHAELVEVEAFVGFLNRENRGAGDVIELVEIRFHGQLNRGRLGWSLVASAAGLRSVAMDGT
ncbi:MAG: hypothetical protein MH213_03460 [Marinobacter sp.]|nr:hypothetical protein [Marinobacter sp.]